MDRQRRHSEKGRVSKKLGVLRPVNGYIRAIEGERKREN